jgi:hypothetical protein
MGRGNVQVEQGEAIYYIDNSYFEAYIIDEDGNETLERDYDFEQERYDDFIINLTHNEILKKDFVIDNDWKNDFRFILSNDYYTIAIVDNQWSSGIALLKKEEVYYFTEDETKLFYEEQKKSFDNYNKLLLKALYELTNELYIPNGAWLSKKLELKGK